MGSKKGIWACKKFCTRALSSECHHTMMHTGPPLPNDPVKLEIELQTEVPLIQGGAGQYRESPQPFAEARKKARKALNAHLNKHTG